MKDKYIIIDSTSRYGFKTSDERQKMKSVVVIEQYPHKVLIAEHFEGEEITRHHVKYEFLPRDFSRFALAYERWANEHLRS